MRIDRDNVLKVANVLMTEANGLQDVLTQNGDARAGLCGGDPVSPGRDGGVQRTCGRTGRLALALRQGSPATGDCCGRVRPRVWRVRRGHRPIARDMRLIAGVLVVLCAVLSAGCTIHEDGQPFGGRRIRADSEPAARSWRVRSVWASGTTAARSPRRWGEGKFVEDPPLKDAASVYGVRENSVPTDSKVPSCRTPTRWRTSDAATSRRETSLWRDYRL